MSRRFQRIAARPRRLSGPGSSSVAWVIGMVSLAALGFRCPGDRPTPAADGGAGGQGAGVGAGGDGGATSTGGSMGGGGEGGGGSLPCVDTGLDVDDDFDGFTEQEGDCDDCDPLSNPQGVELQSPPGFDEDCDGTMDEPPDTCDSTLTLVPGSAFDGAAALDICKSSSGPGDWGLVDARWTRADGSLVADPGFSVGLSDQFGANINPQLGSRMLVLSTGHARDVNDPDPCLSSFCETLGPGTAPTGFPQSVGGCETGSTINDDVALEVDLRVPSNVTGLTFDSAFATFEFPVWVCTQFNDHFLALVSPPPPGAINGNTIFDAQGTPPGSLFEILGHCDPASSAAYAESCMMNCPSPPMPYCPEGPGFFVDTGFDVWDQTMMGSAATGWLITTVPVVPYDEITVRFTVFDVGDTGFDSTVWIDAVGWDGFANATPETFVLGAPN